MKPTWFIIKNIQNHCSLIILELGFKPVNHKRLINSWYERKESPSDTNTVSITMTQIITESIDKCVLLCVWVVDPLRGIITPQLL